MDISYIFIKICVTVRYTYLPYFYSKYMSLYATLIYCHIFIQNMCHCTLHFFIVIFLFKICYISLKQDCYKSLIEFENVNVIKNLCIFCTGSNEFTTILTYTTFT